MSPSAVVNLDDLRTVLSAMGRTSRPTVAEIAAADRLRQVLQPGLFGDALSDPLAETPGRHHGRATEKAAAYDVLPRSGTQRLRVLYAIARAGWRGRTDQELEDELEMQRPSPGNRRGELMTGGWVRDSGERRPTRTGNPAVVWVLTDEGRERLAQEETTHG